MRDDGSNLAALPPADPRGRRLRRWVPGIAFLALLAILGLLIRFVFEESPTAPPAQQAKTTTAASSSSNGTPQAFQELADAAKRAERQPAPPPPPPAVDEQTRRALTDALARITSLEEQLKAEREARAQVPSTTKSTPARNPQAEAEAKRLALERAKAAKDAAKKKADEDAAARKARLIWERKSEKETDVGAVKTVASPYSLMPGWKIPCALEQAISSRASGDVVAKVTQNVYDSATGEYLLIPQEATLIGQSRGGTVFGDDSLQATIDTMVVGRQVYSLGNTGMKDVTGQTGLKDQVETFWSRALMSVVLTGVLRGSATAARVSSDSIGEQIGGAVAQQSLSEGTRQVQQLINIAPRLTIRQGFPCVLTVKTPISFQHPYTPVTAQPAVSRVHHGW